MSSSRKSVVLSLRNAYEALAVSVPTVVDGVRGRLTARECDARLERFAANVMRNAEIAVTIKGTRDVLPSHGMFSRKGVEVHVTIHPPIETSPFVAQSATTIDAKAARDALMNEVRVAIASAL